MKVSFHINNQHKTYHVKAHETLLKTLRNDGYIGVKEGCNASSCGTCTVLINGYPSLACSVLTGRLEGAFILTVEGIKNEIDQIADAFGAEGADQCGFCNPGTAMSVYALKQNKTQVSDEEIKKFIVGNLCRCSGYHAQIKAIRRYLGDER